MSAVKGGAARLSTGSGPEKESHRTLQVKDHPHNWRLLLSSRRQYHCGFSGDQQSFNLSYSERIDNTMFKISKIVQHRLCNGRLSEPVAAWLSSFGMPDFDFESGAMRVPQPKPAQPEQSPPRPDDDAGTVDYGRCIFCANASGLRRWSMRMTRNFELAPRIAGPGSHAEYTLHPDGSHLPANATSGRGRGGRKRMLRI